MNPEDAEEYTKGLGQIVAGVWRQMDEGARLGVPEALGLSTSEWVETRLGGPLSPSAQAQPAPLDRQVEPKDEKTAETVEEGRRKGLSRRVFRGLRADPPAAPAEAKLHPEVARLRLRRSPRHWIVIPVGAVLGLLVGLIWAAATPPSYESQAAAFVALTALPTSDPNSADPFGGSQFALQRVQTYAQIATSPQILQAALRDLHRAGASGVAQNVKVATSGGVILWVTVNDRDPQTAAHLADAVMSNLTREVAELEAGGSRRSPVQLVPIQPAIVPNASAGSGGFIKALLGLVTGLALGGGAFYSIRRRHGGELHDRTGKNTNRFPPHKADPEHRDGVVVLRVGDGRSFSGRAGR